MFGRYELVRRLAGGGMGEVFAATMRGAEGFTKPVALKRIYPHLAGDPLHRQLFVREAKIVAQLSHPNIVQVIELGTEGDELFMAMEFVDGVSLSQILRRLNERQQTLPVDVVVALAVDLLEALAYAHDYADPGLRITGVVHADVSPANVMVTTQGRAKLCDFGVAKLLRANASEGTRRERWGKAAYMAPEQITERGLDARSDLYAIAIVMIEALTGERPFKGADHDLVNAIITGKRPPLAKVAPSVPFELVEIIEKGAAVDAAARFQSADEMRRDLIDALGTQTVDEARRRLQAIVRDEVDPAFEADGPKTHVSGRRPTVSDDKTQARPPTALRPPPSPGVRVGVLGAAAVCALGVLAYEAYELATRRAPAIAITAPQPELKLEEPDVPAAPQPEIDAPAAALVELPVEADTEAPPAHRPRHPHVSRNEPTKAEPAKAEPTKAEPPALFTLNTAPWAYVTIDGKRLSKPTPLFDYELTPGSHIVELHGANGKESRLSLDVRSGEVVRRVVKLE